MCDHKLISLCCKSNDTFLTKEKSLLKKTNVFSIAATVLSWVGKVKSHHCKDLVTGDCLLFQPNDYCC